MRLGFRNIIRRKAVMSGNRVYLDLYLSLVADVADVLSWDSNHSVRFITERFDKEGVSFLTKTLPSLGRRFTRSFDGVTPLELAGFANNGIAPNLFRELFLEVLDPDRRIRKDAPVRVIMLLRQLLLVFYKLQLPYSQSSREEVLQNFVSTDERLVQADWYHYQPASSTGIDSRERINPCPGSMHTDTVGGVYTPSLCRLCHATISMALRDSGPSSKPLQSSGNTTSAVGREQGYSDSTSCGGVHSFECTTARAPSQQWAERLVSTAREIITRVTSGIDVSEFSPRHGPGAVATGEKTWEKWNFSTLYSDLDQFWPFSEYFHASLSHFETRLSENRLTGARFLEHGTAKVVLVPKDSRGPRLISCEPLAYQWIQQGIAQLLVKHIERYPLTRRRINFADQSINQNYARWGSLGANWVTMDLKDASDRVGLDLTIELFADSHILPWLLASRSRSTKLPNGDVIPLKKFAPMGSALCFPVEALIFWSLAVAAIVVRSRELFPNGNVRHQLEKAAETVKVYGDDVICMKEDYLHIREAFELAGLKVNDSKCFTQGPFRESCGVDAYNGIDVTPVYIRRVTSSDGPTITNIPSWVEYHNELYLRGYWRTCGRIRSILKKVIDLPIISDWEPRAYLCLRMFEAHIPKDHRHHVKWSRRYHRREIFAPCSVPVYVHRILKGYSRLFFRLSRKTGPGELLDPLVICDADRHPVRHRISIECRWSPY
jgi:hypothetical protein